MIFERVVRFSTTRFVLWLLSGGGLRAVYYSKHKGDREKDAFYGEPLRAEGAEALTLERAGLRRDKWAEAKVSQHNEFYWRQRVWRALTFLFPPPAPFGVPP